ncbi:hypothetical protein EVAR_37476_1 [Eumeta japonica]|uniref:Uncharacterized protein n=1 Tax=Eumeta variegata TaxID=151549 RepID=A0A4C1XE11_EUMVA|nr:hypothetical protein EVAR_37476_1 [Eumeta japonica]
MTLAQRERRIHRPRRDAARAFMRAAPVNTPRGASSSISPRLRAASYGLRVIAQMLQLVPHFLTPTDRRALCCWTVRTLPVKQKRMGWQGERVKCMDEGGVWWNERRINCVRKENSARNYSALKK